MKFRIILICLEKVLRHFYVFFVENNFASMFIMVCDDVIKK